MGIWPNDRPPSVRIRDVLTGRVRLEDEDPAIQSVCSKHIYDGAIDVLSKPTKEARRKFLDRIPASIRPHVEAEARRIFKERRNG